MVERKPLVIVNGSIQQLQSGDTIEGVTPGSGDKNVDGGNAISVYLPSQNIDGGSASG